MSIAHQRIRSGTLIVAGRAELDAATLAAAQRGDAIACRQFVTLYQRSVHSLLWRMLGTTARRPVVEDLTQEAFLRAFRSLPRFQPEGPAKLSTWLLSIATRTAIDELRRPRMRVGTMPPLPDPSSRPDVAAERGSLARAIATAVDTLGPELRATFVLRGYHDLTYPEIAGALGVDIGTVKSRLYRARRALQAALKEVRHER